MPFRFQFGRTIIPVLFHIPARYYRSLLATLSCILQHYHASCNIIMHLAILSCILQHYHASCNILHEALHHSACNMHNAPKLIKYLTSSLSLESIRSSEVHKLFNLKQVLVDDDSHKDELEQVKKVAANTIGRLIGERLPHLKILRKCLPLHYKHKNSDLPKQPANIMIMKLEGLQETVNSEMVEYLDILQMKYLHEVAEGAENKIEYLEDLKIIKDKDVSVREREEAEERVKKEVLRHGVWIGHGDLLTMKMFYVAKSLR
jgi:hypothetical protein